MSDAIAIIVKGVISVSMRPFEKAVISMSEPHLNVC